MGEGQASFCLVLMLLLAVVALTCREKLERVEQLCLETAVVGVVIQQGFHVELVLLPSSPLFVSAGAPSFS